MAILEGVLLEEIKRLEKNITSYEQMLLSLPRGTIFIRKMGNSYFVYRKRKENERVLTEYLGNSKDEFAQKQIELSNDYKRIKKNIRTTKSELVKLRKAYKAYN